MSGSERGATETADPEVAATTYRRFSAQEKLRIMEAADACTEPGEIGALMRREGIYSSYLSRWRKARARGKLNGVGRRKRGPKRLLESELSDVNAALQRENARLRARLAQAETIIEVQKKLSQLLGVATSALESEEPT